MIKACCIGCYGTHDHCSGPVMGPMSAVLVQLRIQVYYIGPGPRSAVLVQLRNQMSSYWFKVGYISPVLEPMSIVLAQTWEQGLLY